MATTGIPRSAPVADVACASCRRLKMKCIGSDNPPCARCTKAGRECIVQRPARTNYTSGTSTPNSHVRMNGPSSHLRAEDRVARINSHDEQPGPRQNHNFSPINSTVSVTIEPALPSTYTTPSYSTVCNPPEGSPDHIAKDMNSHITRKRRRIGPAGQSPLSLASADPNNNPIPERDIIQYIDIFRKRLLNFIPVIVAEDLDITQLLSTKKQLAWCICYVTARYIPGGDSARAMLVPTVATILRDMNLLPKSEDEEWTMLQALSVLYAYRPSGNGISIGDSTFEISQWTIKGYIEAYALHLGVHRSVSTLKASARSGGPEIFSSIGFKKYIYWLWLFNMSHHYSVITGTPPSIREDATIRIAPEILQGMDVSSSVLQVLAETELCLLWGKAGLEVPGLREWWCPADLTNSPSSNVEQSMLDTVDTLLQSWSEKWTSLFPSEPLGQDIDFHFRFRFTRFCLSTYSVQNLKQVGANGLSSFQQDALNRSVAAAVSFCKLTLELGPAIRDAARYMADFGFVMISFACIFILQACENFYSSVNRASDYLSDVEAVAQMLKEFAVNSNQGPSLQARLILAKLQKINETSSLVGPRDISNRPGEEIMGQDFRFGHGGEEGFVNDPLWNLLDFFPNISLV